MCKSTASLALPKSISCSTHLPNTLSASTGDSNACQTLWMPCWVKLVHWTHPEFSYTQLENSDRQVEKEEKKPSTWPTQSDPSALHTGNQHAVQSERRSRLRIPAGLRWGTDGVTWLCHHWACASRDRGDLYKLFAIVSHLPSCLICSQLYHHSPSLTTAGTLSTIS